MPGGHQKHDQWYCTRVHESRRMCLFVRVCMRIYSVCVFVYVWWRVRQYSCSQCRRNVSGRRGLSYTASGSTDILTERSMFNNQFVMFNVSEMTHLLVIPE